MPTSAKCRLAQTLGLIERMRSADMATKYLQDLGFVATAILFYLTSTTATAQTVCSGEINLLPKYGEVPKCQTLINLDAEFLRNAEKNFPGDPKNASMYYANQGWKKFREYDFKTAMRRFNQAWLIDPTNGNAIWGMGAALSNDTQSTKSQHVTALKLYAEANASLAESFQFELDYARALGLSGYACSDSNATDEAFRRFEKLYRDHPDNTLNLQNWAITLYLQGQLALA